MNNDGEIRECISRNLGDLIEQMILRKGYFRDLPDKYIYWDYVLVKCEKHKKKLSEDQMRELITAEIWTKKYLIINAVVGRKYVDKYNEKYFKACESFGQWVRQEEGFQKLGFEDDEKFKITSIVKDELNKKLVEFEYSKEFSKHGMIAYTKNILNEHKIILTLDKGTLRPFFDVFIGLDNPAFKLEWDLFGGEKEPFMHNNRKNLENSINRIAEYAVFLAPHFERVIADSFAEVVGERPKKLLQFG